MKRLVGCIFILLFLLVSFNVTLALDSDNQTNTKKPFIYYPVPYVPVLKDLQYVAEKSAVLKTPQVVTGMLVFKGDYSAKSLLDFYKVQMPNNGWKIVGSSSASKISFLAYKRPNGTVFISISEGVFSSELRIVIILEKEPES